MKRIITILLCLFLAACERSVLLENNSGKTLKLAQGSEFQINLPENPTTGYTWEFLTDPKNSNIVEQINSEYIAQKGPLLGAGGKKIFTYRAAH